jgi:hypothetical protein
LILIGISFIKVSNDIPLVSTCSIAISAACHRPQEDTDAHLLPIRWGVVSTDRKTPIRCSLTTLRDVRLPMVGEIVGGEAQQCNVDWHETPLLRKRKVYRSMVTAINKIVRKKERES